MSIQEHLNKIRNAIYGREVRESIAKGIETAYDDASEKDNANMEVKIARGTHPNLRSRLDKENEEVTTQLAQTIQQNRTYIDDQLNNLNGLELKGAFSTLQGLKSAYPSGSQGIFLVQENGHWYYWNGSWADGGLYQAIPWDEFMTENNEEWVI